MDMMDISDVFSTFRGINIYIDTFIHPKFIVTGETKPSIFDEYDAENGYTDHDPDNENVYSIYKNMINYIFRYATKSLKNSYKDCLESDLICLLNYIKFDIEQENGPGEDDI